MAVGLQFWKQFIKKHHFTAGIDQGFKVEILIIGKLLLPHNVVALDLIFGAIEQVGVDTALPQLHHCVHQVWHVTAPRLGEKGKILLKNSTVIFLLNICQLDLDDCLFFRLQRFLHILLHPPQHERLEYSLELFNLILVLHVTKLFVEVVNVTELLRLKESEKREQLGYVVLERGSGQQQPGLDIKKPQTLKELALLVLKSVSLINDTGSPADVLEVHDISDDNLVGGDEDMKLVDVLHSLTVLLFVVHIVLLDHVPAGLGAVVDDHVHVSPAVKLPLPVGNGAKGRDDQEGAADAVLVDGVNPGEGLDCLAETHLVSQETVPVLIPGKVEPVDTLKLIRPQCILILKDRRLGPGFPLFWISRSLNLVPFLLWRRVLPPLVILNPDWIHVRL